MASETKTGKSPSDLLLMAADLVEPAGRWVQGALCGDRNGRPLLGAVTGADFCGHCWCALGSIDKAWWNARHAEDERLTSLQSREEAKSLLQQHLGVNPAAWNDAPERTQAEVVSALRAAAKATA